MALQNPSPSDWRSGGLRLLMASAGVSLLWLVVLPWLARRPAMQAHREWLDERGIDPSAMYYTDLEAMEPILRRLERRRRGLPTTPASASTEEQ